MPPAASQSRPTPPSQPAATVSPSGEKQTLKTAPDALGRSISSRPPTTSHRRTDRSFPLPPLASVEPSGENARQATASA